jgi:hypothetical protein
VADSRAITAGREFVTPKTCVLHPTLKIAIKKISLKSRVELYQYLAHLSRSLTARFVRWEEVRKGALLLRLKSVIINLSSFTEREELIR